jgi:Na+-transporting methylmalonyl-CoA/oxaloacetate decarboxylase gamma subunit
MWDVLVTFMLMLFGAFIVIAFGVILIWVLYLLQNEVDHD